MKKLCVVLTVITVGIFLCGFTSKETVYFTIHYDAQSIAVTDKTLKPKWFNQESHQDFTKNRTVYQRAEIADSIENDFPEIHQILKRIERDIEHKAFDGNVNFDPARTEKFWITNAQNGIEMNVALASFEILAALKNRTHADIVIKTKNVPHKTERHVLEGLGLRAEYSTPFDAGNRSRSGNIKRSAECFNGLTLLPGEVLSFNRTVGPRTAARGYEEAKIIVDGEFVQGIGGGVCQTSTTLFNAALLSGLSIVESHNHSLPISYVPAGRDAMVSSAVDLILQNNTSAAVYIESGIEKNNRIFFKVYGNKLGSSSYKPKVEVTQKPLEIEAIGAVPSDMDGYRKVVVQSGYPAKSAKTYLEVYDGSNLVKTKLVRKSNYKGKAEIIRYEEIPEPIVLTSSEYLATFEQ